MTITLQIVCDGIPCGPPLSASAARAWLEFVQHVAPETAVAMVKATQAYADKSVNGTAPRGLVPVGIMSLSGEYSDA